jgi:hypothetical protein
MDKEVLKYRDLDEFKDCLVSVFEEDERCRETKAAMRRYVKDNAAERIADKFIDLFESLK